MARLSPPSSSSPPAWKRFLFCFARAAKRKAFFCRLFQKELRLRTENKRWATPVPPGRHKRGLGQAEFLRDGSIRGRSRSVGPGQAERGRASKSLEKANPDRNRSTFVNEKARDKEGSKQAEFCLKKKTRKRPEEMAKDALPKKKRYWRGKTHVFFFHRKIRDLKNTLKNWFSNRQTRFQTTFFFA